MIALLTAGRVRGIAVLTGTTRGDGRHTDYRSNETMVAWVSTKLRLTQWAL